jgi:hypothetical protein
MTDQSRQFTAWPGQSGPVNTFLGILTGMLGNGLSTLERLAAGSGRHRDETAPSFCALLGPMKGIARLFDAVSSGAPGLGANAEAGQAAISQVADMSPAIAQACGVAAVSSMRYLRALAELHLRYQATLMEAAAGRSTASSTGYRVLADEVRAFLREIGDAATQEARRLQLELEKVGESVARAADQATLSQHLHRRRHEVKE